MEYGVVEDRLCERYPAVAEELMSRYGHTWRGSHRPANQFSMAAYLAARLSELAAEGHLQKTFGPATGAWSYNGVISYWQVAGGEAQSAETTPDLRPETPHSPPVGFDDIDRLVSAARNLPPARGNYTETDFVMNLLETVLDYQMNTSVVVKALHHYKANHWDGIRSLDDLDNWLEKFEDTDEGNRSLARSLWGNNHWTRAHQLRELAAFFRSIGVVDQPSLQAWAAGAEFGRDFRGRVRGLGPAVFQWLVMRQGVDTVKPDVHVRRFAEGVVGRSLGDSELIDLIVRCAAAIDIPARELDWRIWEASRGGGLEYPG